MKIIFLTITYDPEPGALRGLPLAKWLVKRGHEVKVLTTFPQYPIGKIYPGYKMKPWQWEVMEGIPVLRVPIYPSHDYCGWRRALTYLSFMLTASVIGTPLIGPADVVYLYEPPPTNGLASLLLKWLRGTPIVHHIADMWPETVLASGMVRGDGLKRLAEKVIGCWCRFLYDQAAVMTVLSPGFKRLLMERGVPEEKIRVIYNWTDEDTFKPLPRNEELGRELGLERGFNIIYAGNFGPMQGLDVVVAAAALLKDTPDLRFVLIGTGPMEAELRAKIQEANLHNVVLLPRRQYWEMPAINALADALLVHLRDFPFLHSTIPSKTQVALASGRPLLMAVRGDAADIVADADAGEICEPDNPRALADAALRLWRLPRSVLEQKGDNGRRYYLEHLSLDIAGRQMDEALKIAYEARANKHNN